MKKKTMILPALCLLLAALCVLFLCLWMQERADGNTLSFATDKILLTASETEARDEAEILACLNGLPDAEWEIKVVFYGMLEPEAVEMLLAELPYEELTLVFDEAMLSVYILRMPRSDVKADALRALSNEAVVKTLSFAESGAFAE